MVTALRHDHARDGRARPGWRVSSLILLLTGLCALAVLGIQLLARLLP